MNPKEIVVLIVECPPSVLESKIAFAAGLPALVWLTIPDPLAAEARKGQEAMSRQQQQHRILCVTSSAIHHKTLHSVLHLAKYKVDYCMTVDHAVGFCISTGVSAIVLASAFLTGQDWSAVQTFKSICPGIPILVLANKDKEKIPPDVDAIVKTPELLIHELRRLIDGHLPPE